MFTAASVLLALCTFIFSAYTRWRVANQTYYAHLSKVWYDLRKEELKHPEWLDPEVTSLYGLQQVEVSRLPPTAYDIHAWACWALAEDWYETSGRTAELHQGPKRRWLFGWPPRNELTQFAGVVRGVTELHWSWLRYPGNRCRFDTGFVDWVEREFLLSRTELSKAGVIHGTGVVARCDLSAGAFIGCFDGTVQPIPGTHTLQIGVDTHLAVSGPMRYLNHADSPNAVIRGLSVFALVPIAQGVEITVNYNYTEDSFKFDDGQPRGFQVLKAGNQLPPPLRLHRWIREREAPPVPTRPASG